MWHSLGSWRVGMGGERWRWDLILPEAGDFLLVRPGRVWDGRRARTRVRAFPGVGKEPPNSVTPESSRPSAAYLPRGGDRPLSYLVLRRNRWFSKCGPWTSGSSITWELARSAYSTCRILRRGQSPASLCSNKPSGSSDALGCETRCSGL